MTIGHNLLTTIASKDAAIETHASSIQRACPVMRASPAPMVAIKSAKAESAQRIRMKALSNGIIQHIEADTLLFELQNDAIESRGRPSQSIIIRLLERTKIQGVAPVGGLSTSIKTSKESSMYRLLSCSAVVICMALTPALAADDSSQAGATDQSTGAKEQSSAPPASGAASDTKPMGEMKPSSGSMDTSQGAKEQSSAPPDSSASDPSKPNPAMGTEKE